MKAFILTACCMYVAMTYSQNLSVNKFILKGIVNNRDTGYIILAYTNSFGKFIRDTAFLKNGNFQFEGEIPEPVFATIKGYTRMIDYENVNYTEIFLEPTVQKIELVENNYALAKLDGSRTQNEYDNLKISLNSIKARYKNLYKQIALANDAYKIAITNEDKELAQQKANEFIEQLKPEREEIRQAVISFVLTHPDSYVSPYFFYTQLKQLPVDSAKRIFQKLTTRIQKSINGVFIADLFKQIEQNVIGNIPYNFKAQDIRGKNVSLLDFRGKYLYIDFWASWCIPCREQIPNLKKIFNQYHSYGLEILTISIDKDIEQWKAAIVKDDIGNWYNILANKEIEDNYDNVNNPIPSGMLIGQDGKIVWKSGADETLEVALKRLINKS
jgi:thiol-disulfide isomerase/thioredoxin